jgi:hypothetical protein
MLKNIFIGREYEQQCYRDLLCTDTPWVLIFTGMGQSGKSRLLRHLKEQTPRTISVIKLDFTMNGLQTDHLSVLREFVRQIEGVCKYEDAVAFKKTVDDGRNKIMQLSAQAQDIILQMISADGGAVTGNQLKIKLDKKIQEIKRQVLEEMLDSFYTLLASFCGDRLVLMLDTCELLKQGEVGPWVLDELIPATWTRLQEQGKQFSVVMASRVQPQLNAIDKQDQRTFRLPLFSKSEVGQYLQHMGLQDPAILDYVYDLTHGHVGSILILSKLCEQQEQWPSSLKELQALQDQFIENVRTDIIEDDFLNERFIQSPYRELTRYGVLLRQFNQSLLQAVFPEWLPDLAASERFDLFTRFPHVMPPKDNYYTFFDMLREILISRIFGQEKGMWIKYHGLALNYLSRVAPQTSEWWYHDLAYKLINNENWLIDREKLAQIKAALEEAKVRKKPTRADYALLEAVSDKALNRILLEAENAEEELASS